MNNDEVSRGIINALLKLSDSAQYTCDAAGATAIAGLMQSANNHINTLTESIADAAEEVTDNE